MGIFDNFDKLELEEMRFEVALFQAISISSYANEMKTYAKNKGTKIINTVSGMLNKKGVDETKIETVEELVAEKCEELKYAIREELHDEMVKVIKDRLISLGVDMNELTTEDRIAYFAIKEAQKNISSGVGADASMAQKADDIASLFSKKQIKELKGNITQNRQDRDLLAHFIWKVSVHNQAYFSVGIEEAEGEAVLDEELQQLLRDKTNYQQREKDASIAITGTEYKIAGAKANIVDLESKMVYVDKRISEYEMKGEQESADAESARRVKSITESEIQTKKNELAEYEVKLETLKNDKLSLEEEKKQKETKEEELVKKMTELLKKKWSEHLLGVVIVDSAIEHLVRVYSLSDRKVLESALIELGTSPCTDLIAEKDQTGENQIFSFVISKTAVGRVVFKNDNGIMEVSKILKLRRS